jgi:hypothetical protein
MDLIDTNSIFINNIEYNMSYFLKYKTSIVLCLIIMSEVT